MNGVLALALYRPPSWTTRLNPCQQLRLVWMATFGYGFVLMIWIATEVILIGFDSWLQPLHFGIGLTFSILAMTPWMRSYLSVMHWGKTTT